MDNNTTTEQLPANDRAIRVYHVKAFQAAPVAQFPADFDCVAVVHYGAHVAGDGTEGLEAAYHLTQNLERSWIGACEQVHYTGTAAGCRSTSVGDVLIDQQGRAYMVAGCGFARVPASGVVDRWAR